jgi:hypothetical protein
MNTNYMAAQPSANICGLTLLEASKWLWHVDGVRRNPEMLTVDLERYNKAPIDKCIARQSCNPPSAIVLSQTLGFPVSGAHSSS